MKCEIITWVCTNSPTDVPASEADKLYMHEKLAAYVRNHYVAPKTISKALPKEIIPDFICRNLECKPSKYTGHALDSTLSYIAGFIVQVCKVSTQSTLSWCSDKKKQLSQEGDDTSTSKM